jgi:hypothetical protein
MAVALTSLGLQLPVLLECLYRAVDPAYAKFDDVPLVAAPVETAGTPVLQQLRAQTQKLGHSSSVQDSGVHGKALDLAGKMDGLGVALYWLHAERLIDVPPGDWQQYLAWHLLGSGSSGGSSSSGSSSSGSSSGGSSSGGSSSGGGGGSGDSSSSRSMLLVADLACDWCAGQLATTDAVTTAAAAAGLQGGRGSWVCASCGAAQYCSQRCADGARKVHGDNCW